MYTRDGGLILKDGVVLSTVEIVDLLNKLQKVNDKWDKLDEEIGKFYDEPTYDAENDCEFEEEGSLLEIGELCCEHFGYL
jgi:hypothetical protein|nr:MAG TPA: hypothetical protein [Caudoviricetes sp.]